MRLLAAVAISAAIATAQRVPHDFLEHLRAAPPRLLLTDDALLARIMHES